MESNVESKAEIILKLGAEGGSITLYGIPPNDRDEIGEWIFTLDLNEIFADQNKESYQEEGADKDLVNLKPTIERPSGPLKGWEGALAILEGYPWKRLFPRYVHVLFRERFLEEVGEGLSIGKMARWKRVCEGKIK
ncbi:hypothetical protein [Bacillus marinisedimentorum]|uniref:hypothetical protein n=1 Tax=Bacillus marinisedimentorum TaxID=1821260 RepID=UPI0008727FE0|nr:hypothetical protein [Bacillus marinisedimentorum]